MIGFVVQEQIPPESKKLYSPNRIPKTVIVLEEDLLFFLRTVLKQKILDDSSSGIVVKIQGNDPENTATPSYFWGVVTRPNDIQSTPYPHFLNKKARQSLMSSLPKGIAAEDLKQWGLEVPPVIVQHYNLKEGDQVELKVLDNRRLIVITRVNGCDDPEIIRDWQTIGEPKSSRSNGTLPRSAYPTMQFPIEKYGDPNLRAITLLAPVGFGNLVAVAGPAQSGKSTMLKKTLVSLCRMTHEKNLKVVVCFIGERPEDMTDYLDVIVKEKPKPNTVEYYEASWDDDAIYQVQVAQWAMNRIRRLTAGGGHTAYILDAGSRVAEALSDTDLIPTSSGMIRGGMFRRAVRMTARDLRGSGNFGSGWSCTGWVTMLTASQQNKDEPPTSEAAFAEMVRKSRFNCYWTFTDADTGGIWPSILMVPGNRENSTREKERIVAVDQLEEMEAVDLQIWKKMDKRGKGVNSPFLALHQLVEYARAHPIPEGTKGVPQK